MYHRMRRKFGKWTVFSAILTVQLIFTLTNAKTIYTTDKDADEHNDKYYFNNAIDFDDEYDIKFNKKYDNSPIWNLEDEFNKESHRYLVVNHKLVHKLDVSTTMKPPIESMSYKKENKYKPEEMSTEDISELTTEFDFSVIPLELISTTKNSLLSILESTAEPDLTVIPLSTTTKKDDNIIINETITLPTSTENVDNFSTTTDVITTTDYNEKFTSNYVDTSTVTTERFDNNLKKSDQNVNVETFTTNEFTTVSTEKTSSFKYIEHDDFSKENNKTKNETQIKTENLVTEHTFVQNNNKTNNITEKAINGTKRIDTAEPSEEEVSTFTDLETTDSTEVAEDYYDSKDVIPTKAPSKDALSVIFGLAGSMVESVVESVAERVVPKGIFDLFKRMQRQSEALEVERLRSREENGGLGQFGRGILKTISSGLSKPFTQLMAGVRDIGSLDNDRSFVTSLASGVTSVANVANSLVDNFKDRVQAIYPGTVWCGDGRIATARSGDLGLFFFTDTCCREHDACKMYIRAGETKFGLTNTGLFTRSHCSCDAQFRECLHKTNSLVSAQIGLTYFNVLGPQCFRKAHPIVKCIRKTRITGLKCEEYEMDYTKPKMWQWFDNETF